MELFVSQTLPAFRLTVRRSQFQQKFVHRMSDTGQILRVDPAAAIAGGEVVIDCAGFDTSEPNKCGAYFQNEKAPLVALGAKRVLALATQTQREPQH